MVLASLLVSCKGKETDDMQEEPLILYFEEQTGVLTDSVHVPAIIERSFPEPLYPIAPLSPSDSPYWGKGEVWME